MAEDAAGPGMAIGSPDWKRALDAVVPCVVVLKVVRTGRGVGVGCVCFVGEGLQGGSIAAPSSQAAPAAW